MSTTKGITATCANLLVQRGLLELDTPVARYWSEFVKAGSRHSCSTSGSAYPNNTIIANDQPLLIADIFAAATTEQTNGHDRILERPNRYEIGYCLPTAAFPLQGPRSFRRRGNGGSLSFADLDHHIAFGYILNQMHPRIHH